MDFLKRFLSFFIIIALIASLASLLSACNDSEPLLTTKKNSVSDKIEEVTDIDVNPDPELVYEDDPALEISEICVGGSNDFKDAFDKKTPWIEIRNRTSDSIKLSQYKITVTGKEEPIDLPDATIGPLEYYVLLLDGKESANSLPITSIPTLGNITLTHGDKITYSANYYNPNSEYSFITSLGSENEPTPGYASVVSGNTLIISEILSSNGIYPMNGKLSDWIELYNSGSNPIDLSDYYLSKTVRNLYAFRLPNVSLGAGEYIVFSSDNDLPFNISKSGDRVYLTQKGGIIAGSVFTGELEKNCSWTYDLGVVNTPSPGYKNSTEFCSKFFEKSTGLFISEVISNNMSYPVDGDACDLIEITNKTGSDVSLADYRLSDKGSELDRYQFPDITLKDGECIAVICGNSSKGAPFSVSSEGEKLYLSDKDGDIVDILVVPHLPVDISYGRSDKGIGCFKTPSLGKINSSDIYNITASPVADVETGFHFGDVHVTLSGPGKIHFTVDGTKPTSKSPVYSGQVITLSKTGTIRAYSEVDGEIPSEPVAFDYIIDVPALSGEKPEEILNDPQLTLPVVKLSMNPSDFDGSNGIYTNYNNSKLEKEVNFTYFVDGVQQFSVSCGIKVFGNTSRKLAKKSYSLRFRKSYGTSKLKYKLFDNLDINEFNSIVLRSGSQNAESYLPFITDEFISSLVSESGNMEDLLLQAYQPCNLYLNDDYLGIYYIRERTDDDFVASHWNVDKETVTIVQWVDWVKSGSSDQGWHALWKAVKNNDMSNSEKYHEVADQINLESFADLYITRIWAGDIDADNIRVAKSPDYDGGKWHFILFDTDLCFAAESNMKTAFSRFMTRSSMDAENVMFRKFLKNSEFKEFFFTRLGEQIKNTLSPELASARIDFVYNQIHHDMYYNVERWKSVNHKSMSAWDRQISILRKFAVETRLEYLIKDLCSTYGFKSADIEKYFGSDYTKYMS
ncbi:MAG: CotH kinase family protein [Clostridia bacterium]|nr:CotH kinase family protein [Clostridia bacterium]